MKYLTLALLVMVSLMAGCAGPQLSDAQWAAMHKPTMEIECESRCSVTYTDPRDRPAMPTNGYDVANNALSSLTTIATSVAPWLAVGHIAVEGIQEAGDRINNNIDSTHTPTVVNQPDPVVVPQPDPIVVTPPDPIVVTPPDPIVVGGNPSSP